MKKNSQSGFTLIELLVVIAIIGILASVVMASVRTAQNRANDKAIQTNMLTIRNQAGLYFDSNKFYGATDAWPAPGSYNCSSGMFASDSVLQAAIAKLRTYTGPDYIACSATDTAYVVAAQLKASNDYYCIDSKAVSKVKTAVSAPDGLIGFGTNSVINMTDSSCN
ncbi:MAG: hypothetical protein QG674_369 [Patescibacteria group bacterium]|nr:hypothetical protein [Patescibacteria group bacterium]